MAAKKTPDIPTALQAQYPGALRAASEQESDGGNDVAVDMEDMTAEPDMEENEDGSVSIFMDKKDSLPTMDDSEFDANLAEVLPANVLQRLADKYMRRIEDAIQARQKRDEMYEQGLKRAGLGDPAPGGAEFEGASRVTHPVLAEAYVDFAASMMKELFPPSGPVRTQIIGTVNADKLDRAQRKRDYMNYQLTKLVPEYRSELEILMTQLGVGGSQFLKVYWSDAKCRTVVEFVGIDEIILPFNAKGMNVAPYWFHRMRRDEWDVEKDINSGLYRDVTQSVPVGFAEDTKTETQNQKIEGKDFNWGANEDGEFIFFEGPVYEDEFDDPMRPDGMACPYILTIDEGSNQVIGLYRNWSQDDKLCLNLNYMVEFKFIPWRGAYGIGFPHLIGDLASALTGTLRALLDSAHIQNAATGVKLKGRPGGETVSMSPTQVGEVDALAGDDIRKVFMPMTFNGPSPVLLQLLGFLQSAAKGVVTTSEEKVADSTGQMPVGTTLALIEQGAKVYSSIHARQHHSQEEVLAIIHRLNFEHMPEKVKFGDDDRDFVERKDFRGPATDVFPVSDPNIFSEVQRFAQMQMVLAMAEKAPTIMDLKKCYERMLQLAKVPDFKELMVQPTQATSINPAAENVQMAMGKMTAAFPDQDHLAHIQVHLDFLKNPLFGMNQVMGKTIIPGMLEHVKQHMLFYYANLMQLEAGQQMRTDVTKLLQNDKTWQTDRDVSEALAHSSATVTAAINHAFEGIPPVVQQAMQFMQQMAQQQQQDPAFKIAMMELQQRQVEHKDEMQLEQQRLMQQMKKMMGDQQIRMQQLEQNMQKFLKQDASTNRRATSEAATKIIEANVGAQSNLETTHLKNQNDLSTTEMDNDTALEIAEMRGSQLKDGKSMTKH